MILKIEINKGVIRAFYNVGYGHDKNKHKYKGVQCICEFISGKPVNINYIRYSLKRKERNADWWVLWRDETRKRLQNLDSLRSGCAHASAINMSQGILSRSFRQL